MAKTATAESFNELSHKEMIDIHKDSIKAAEAADLIYVNDQEEGISRIKKGKVFPFFIIYKII